MHLQLCILDNRQSNATEAKVKSEFRDQYNKEQWVKEGKIQDSGICKTHQMHS